MFGEFVPGPEEMGIKPEEMLSDVQREKMKEHLGQETLLELDSRYKPPEEKEENLDAVEKAIGSVGEKTIAGLARSKLNLPLTGVKLENLERIINNPR